MTDTVAGPWTTSSSLAGRLLAVALVTLLALLGSAASRSPAAAGPAGSRAVAPVGTGNLQITVNRFRPAIPTAKSTLDVRGSVTNVSQGPIDQVAVALRISPTALYNRTEITQVLSGNTTREGVRIESTLATLSQSLPAGQSVDFELSLPLSQVKLPRAGVYVTAVEALGITDGYLQRQALYRTFLPWWPTDTPAEPVGLSMLWPLTGPPLRDATGVYLNDQLGVQMSATGRLDTLVAAAAERADDLTWVLDPQVVQAAEGMSEGYRVYPAGGGKPTAGTRSAEAGRWLSQLTQTLTQGDPVPAISGLYGNPDVDAAKRGRALGNLLSQRAAAQEQMSAILGRDIDSALVLAPAGNADPDTVDTLAAAKVTGLALSATSMPATTPVNFTQSGSTTIQTPHGEMPVLLADPGLQATLDMPASSTPDTIALRQRMLAETEVTALEAPNLERILVASPSAEWAPSVAGVRAALRALSAPWVVPISAQAVLTSPDRGVARTQLALTPAQVALELPAPDVDQVRANQRAVTEYRSMVTLADEVPLDFQQSPARQLSAYFRDRQPEWAQLSDKVSEQVSAAVQSVTVVSSGSVTISGESGSIPVTVSNTGAQQVTVGLEFTSRPPQLFSADPIPPFEIEPGRLTSIEVRAQVAGSTNIPVAIQLVGADGRAIGEPTILVVRSAAYARAARVIVQLSLAVLVFAVLVHGVRRARRAVRGNRKPEQRAGGQ